MTIAELDDMIERLKTAANDMPTLIEKADVDYAIMALRHLRIRLSDQVTAGR